MDPAAAPLPRTLTREFLPAAGLTALALATALAPLTSNDLWLHLATGRWMVAHRSLPGAEVFSFVAAGRPYVAHEWGSELIFYALYWFGGLAALVAFKAIWATWLAGAVYWAARKRGATPVPAVLLTGLAVFVSGAHLWVRPHLFTWGASILLVALLRYARGHPRALLALIPLQVVWTNLHGGFVLGPAIILAWAAGEGVRLRLHREGAHPWRVTLVGLSAAAACLINPYGWSLLRLPFQLTGSPLFMQAIFEWQSPFISSYMTTTMFAGFLIMAGLMIRALVRAAALLDPCDLAVVGLALLLAVRMSRNVPLFVLLAAAPLAASFGSRQDGPEIRWPLRTVSGLLLAAALSLILWGYPYAPGQLRPRGLGPGPAVPVAACDFVQAHHLHGRAFTTYGEGAYVVWSLWPQVRVSMDSRNSVYGEDLYRQYRRALQDPEATRAYMDQWRPDLAIVGHSGPFKRGWDKKQDRDLDLPHKVLMEGGRMLLVDFDDLTAVYATPRACRESGEVLQAYHVIHPVLLPAVFPASSLPRAIVEAERATTAHPESILTHWILAKAYAQAHRTGESLAQLERIAHLDESHMNRWGLAGSMQAARLSLKGWLQFKQGHCQAARQALEAALQANPDYQPARDLLGRLDC